MKIGDKYGRWTLAESEPLGKGGNGEVWKVRDEKGAEGAMKLLSNLKRYPRFRDEVAFQAEHSGREGILPLLDFNLPGEPAGNNRPWLVMPIAMSLRSEIEKSTDKLRSSVLAALEIAKTLAWVHDLGAAHRDIKPENLYYFDGRATLGDFGLVDFPEKQPLTAPGERMGPIFYIAPESIGNNNLVADPRPADIFSLAKTLWVLATGMNNPIPGQFLQSIECLRVGTYVHHPLSALIEGLLERATSYEPARRPTAIDFAAELEAWLHYGPPEDSEVSMDVGLTARLRRLSSAGEEADRRRTAAYSEFKNLLEHLASEMGMIGDLLMEKAGQSLPASRSVGSGEHGKKHFQDEESVRHGVFETRWFSVGIYSSEGRQVCAMGFVMLELLPLDCARLRSTLLVRNQDDECKYVHSNEKEFVFGTAVQDAAVKELLREMKSAISRLIEEWIGVIESDRW